MSLLEDRFGFRFHRESREQPVYWMVARKSGVKLKPHQDGLDPAMSVNGGGRRKILIATGVSMKGVTADEIAMMQEIRWWTAEEVESALARGEKVFPVDLAGRMREFGAD